MRLFLILFFFTNVGFAQLNAVGPFETNMVPKDPVQFTHVPFLLLRLNPIDALGYNNTLNFGAEVAPPFGKLSFAFDYGVGKGSQNLNKVVREMQADNKNKVLRGEIKAYFSDWIPFYALDQKPFGRYYSIEYINGQYDRKLGIPLGTYNVLGEKTSLYKEDDTREQSHVVHLKIGKHIHFHRHLFIDVFAGVGAGYSKFESLNASNLEVTDVYNPVEVGFLTPKRFNDMKSEKVYFSKTLGFRIVFPL